MSEKATLPLLIHNIEALHTVNIEKGEWKVIETTNFTWS